MKFTHGAALACAAALSIAATGCGSSSSSSTSATSATTSTSAASAGLSGPQLATQVNAICDSYSAGLVALGAQPKDFATNPVSAAAYLDKLKPLIESTDAKATSLTPASSVTSDYNTFVAATKHQLAYFESADRKAHARDPSGLQDIASAGAYKQRVLVPIDQKLGFTSCLN